MSTDINKRKQNTFSNLQVVRKYSTSQWKEHRTLNKKLLNSHPGTDTDFSRGHKHIIRPSNVYTRNLSHPLHGSDVCLVRFWYLYWVQVLFYLTNFIGSRNKVNSLVSNSIRIWLWTILIQNLLWKDSHWFQDTVY